MTQKIVIIGGGIAGISAAVFCKELGFNVELLESSPKLGGRAYAFYDKEQNQYFDNGQHILAGWYENTLRFFDIIGSKSKLNFQNSLEVNFFNTDQKKFHLKIPAANPPYNILKGIFSYKALSLRDKFSFLKFNSFIKSPIPDNDIPVNELFIKFSQTENLIKYFWEPFLLAVFNATPENISSVLLYNVLTTGFKNKNSSALLIPNVNLNELYIDDSISYFNNKGIKYSTGIKVKRIELNGKHVNKILLDNGEEIMADEYICSVPFFRLKELFEPEVFNEHLSLTENLKTSAITSVHLFFEEDIPEEIFSSEAFGMNGLIGTKVQWVFKRSTRHLSLVISGSDFLDNITEMAAESILNLSLKELSLCFTGFEKLKLKSYKVIKEKRATFLPEAGSEKYRLKSTGTFENLSFAGDWINTGLPSTLESAVKSSAEISQHLNSKYSIQ